ncbi:MAG: HAD family hydrolase [Alphaproteobacteria bacterium]|nr:HAD family hydrolase [Alphaproteobacteria bacterium]MCB9793805.1 HAD family hydrolase [Alphaproteobacteria bacterium]
MPRLLILDFDGTVTDAEAEGAPFREGYLTDLAVLTGLSVEEVRALAERFEAEVAADPDRYGWMYEGHIVAPAMVDPYLRIMPVARRVFDHAGAFLREEDRTRLLDGVLYKYNYTKTGIAFRPGAREALEALEGQDVFIVTNSHTEAVKDKVRRLGQRPDGSNSLAWLVDRVHGRAKKYVIDDGFEAVPAQMSLPGLGRPVLLRRRLYFEVLDALRRELGADWSEVQVVGDIFELDLCLPLYAGARVALAVNRFTPAYERAFLEAHPRGAILEDFSELGALLRS